jgi:Ca2+-transporting ATPase
MTSGITSSKAKELLVEFGPNEIKQSEGTNPWLLLATQFKSPMIVLLLVAAAVSGALKELPEAIAIVSIVVLNALVGFFQEYRAEKAVMAMRQLTAPRAQVLRDGQASLISASEVVPGDVLLLDGGSVVAADAKLLEAHALSTVEATLTGESLPVQKDIKPSPADAPLADRTDTVFMGTPVATGSGRALVYATGARTELGKIAQLLATATEQPTPLQMQLMRVGNSLLWLCLAVVALVAGLGLWRGIPWIELFVSSISLAVAAVPEGLPAIVTVALSIGVRRMATRKVLVRKLPAVEALGSTTVICTDKTGTLTTGQMSVREVVGDEKAVLTAAALCCDAELNEKGGVGDPTEIAILQKAKALGFERPALEQAHPRLRVFPFDAVRKRMAVERADALYVKGAVDLLLPLCVAGTQGIEQASADMARRGLRVLGVAVRQGAFANETDPERGLTMVGILGLADPPRPAAIEAIRVARDAGIKVVMMTGDHPHTAEAIAREMGLLRPGEAMEGRVYARVAPEDKLRIVRELKSAGEVVAMTGDGTNDAPALKEAHVGIAMGIAGVEVTREAADLVLGDDDFSSIIAAVKEGRGIYDNIRKTLVYLLAGNIGELFVTFVATLIGLPLPLLALHLLWVNLVTDGVPALALVMDPVADDVLSRRPRPQNERMLGRTEWTRIFAGGALLGLVSFVAFAVTLQFDTLPHARTMVFSTLVFAQIVNVMGYRSFDKSAWAVGFFTNPRLLAVMGITALLQVGLVALPFTNELFELGPFSWSVMGTSFVLGLIPVTVLELWKLVTRLFHRKA